MIIRACCNFLFRNKSFYNSRFLKFPVDSAKQLSVTELNQYILNYIIEDLPYFFRDNKLSITSTCPNYSIVSAQDKKCDITFQINAKKDNEGVLNKLSINIIKKN